MPPAAAGGHGPKSCQKALSFCVFELATPYSAAEGRRSVSSSIDFCNNFSHPSSANLPPAHPIGLLKSRQNPSVQALFGELDEVILVLGLCSAVARSRPYSPSALKLRSAQKRHRQTTRIRPRLPQGEQPRPGTL